MIRNRFIPLLVLGLALGLALAASAGAAAPKPGSRAPAFNLPDLIRGGNAVSLRSLEGKVVMVDFWASWCPPCRKTLPLLGRMRLRHPSLVVLAVSVDEDRSKALDFLASRRDTSLVYLHDPGKSAAADYDLGGMPSLYLIDKKGVLRCRFDGYSESDMKQMEEETRKLLEEP
ncbi:MAG TPA: TlpA disulfide reductase family protein [Fibrobacteria bacterium]|nr:TlpA disulfide reductase family protein [Fibrobacteria bacterium]